MESEVAQIVETVDEDNKVPANADGVFLTLEQLQTGAYPDGVDVSPAKKEQFLSDDDFKKHIGVTKDEWTKLAKHKQKRIK